MHEPGSFRTGPQIVFGIGAEERVLEERSEPDFADLVRRLHATRGPHGARHQPLWRLHPERWLESLVIRDLSALDERLDSSCLYSQGRHFPPQTVPCSTCWPRLVRNVSPSWN